ncbi:MAG: hypothetical protein BA866_00490 [Desulfobulbaceae bacterium S5133MH15]|nr:MAG: hypothetical protein BA866_00490 [Desulfobulbaceae bacterium S5133MH15]
MHQIKFSFQGLTDILSEFDDGVMITDKDGTILFYNKALSRIDNIDCTLAIGKKISEVYNVSQQSSPTMQCLRQKRPILRFVEFYLTRQGRAVSALQNVFPLIDDGRLTGAINFIREYSAIEKEMDSTSRFHIQNRKHKNSSTSFHNIIGNNSEFLWAIHTSKMAAASPSPIMICGETGTGKEMFAQAIHNYGQPKHSPFIAINCSAIPETLLEGILFGTSKGAFTDALEKSGLFEDANGGSLFLDELNSMPIGLQAKLLRAIQEKKIRRVGSAREIDINIKLISSVNVDPEQAIQDNTLRRDLYYRLAVVFISIPPLRNRIQDLSVLLDHFIRKCNKKLNQNIRNISNEVLQLFLTCRWSGNVRELEHVIEGAMNMVSQTETIETDHLPVHFVKAAARLQENEKIAARGSGFQSSDYKFEAHGSLVEETGLTLFELQNRYEKELLCSLLKRYRGNANKAAIQLGISRQLIYYKIKKYAIHREKFKQ